MGFRMTVSPFPRTCPLPSTPMSMAFHFHPPLHTNRAFQEAETVAFGYPRERLFLNSGSK